MYQHCKSYAIISDQHTGDDICSGCGIVCDSLQQQQINYTKNFDDFADIKNKHIFRSGAVNEEHLQLIDICTNANLPVRYAHEANMLYIQTLKKLITNARERKNQLCSQFPKSELKQLLKTNLKKAVKQNLLLLCLYETLITNDAAHTLKEVCGLSGASLSQLSYYQKLYFPQSPPILPIHILHRMATKIGYTKQEILKIEHDICNGRYTYTEDYRPSTILAAILWINNKKREKAKRLDLDLICEVCGVSKSTVDRYIRLFLT